MTHFARDSDDLPRLARVIVQRSAAGDAGPLVTPPSCRYMRRVRVLAQYVSADGRRAVYVLEAPDAEVVRELVRAALPDEDVAVWTATAVD